MVNNVTSPCRTEKRISRPRRRKHRTGDAVLPLILRELADASLRNGNDEILLEALARASYSEPLAKLLENRLNGAEPQVAASAAWVLARHAGAEEKPIFQ